MYQYMIPGRTPILSPEGLKGLMSRVLREAFLNAFMNVLMNVIISIVPVLLPLKNVAVLL